MNKKTHELKCWPRYFQPTWQGNKTFEIRKNDRNFQPGDQIILNEWKPNQGKDGGNYTGRKMYGTITHILANDKRIKDSDDVILSLVYTKQTEDQN